MKNTTKILFIDDQWCQPEERNTIIAAFGSLLTKDAPCEFFYETAEISPNKFSTETVLRKISEIETLDVIILDIMFGSNTNRFGLEILDSVRSKYPLLPIFMMTSVENDLDVLERSMELGANEYLVKRPTVEELENLLRIYTNPNVFESDYALWGNSESIRKVRSQIVRVAASGSASVLIRGESGTGKELVARSIHRQGPRKKYPFIDKNCAHSKSELLDDDLFGHEKGAFTGAERQLMGRIERANKGILFLDEIGSMPLELQGKLLRILETKTFQRLGGSQNVIVDFQLITATNQDISSLLESGHIRNDFFFRIKQFEINVPPLRERKEDIPILAELFLKKFKNGTGASYRANLISSEAMNNLVYYNWPGNVRELKNVVERAVIISKEEVIEITHLPPEISQISVNNSKISSMTVLDFLLDQNPVIWPEQRIISELKLLIQAKERIKSYKGNQWKAEFMRLMFPENKAQSAKGFNDLIRRLTKGPWGFPEVEKNHTINEMINNLLS